MVEFHLLLWIVNIDGTRLGGHQVGAEDHLTESFVVHVLQAGLLLGRVHIDSLVLLIHFMHELVPTVLCGQQLMVESLLFLRVCQHIFKLSNYKEHQMAA